MHRTVSRTYLLPLIRRALNEGATPIIHGARWDVAGSCDAPVSVSFTGRQARGLLAGDEMATRLPFFLDMAVPCRRCGACLLVRARRWRVAAEAEIAGSARTWFGTLTVAPEHQYSSLVRGLAERRARGIPREDLGSLEEWRARHRVISRAITLWIKRLREAAPQGAAFRYLCVAEAHKSGLPHYHMLLHEVFEEVPLRHRLLKGSWPLGHDLWKLADKSAARYMAKYLAKSALARVRASLRYGDFDYDAKRFEVAVGRLSGPKE